MAGVMGVDYHDEDFIKLQQPAGSGIIKVIDLASELQVLLADIVLNRHFIAKREKSAQRYYVLHFENAMLPDTAKFSVDNETVHQDQSHHAVVRLTSNMFSNTEEIPAQTSVKAVKVFFSEAWLKKYLGLDEAASGLQKYVSLKTACFDIEPLDAEYLRLMDKLWNVKKDDPLQNIFLQNRVSLLIERFFSRLAEKIKRFEGMPDKTEEEVQQLMKVENLLVQALGEAPPTIDELSKMVGMSATKLKKSFKEMYGSGIYTYYQQMRLQKAKELLTTGNYSVSETAEKVGFNNTANFSTAFKKQFNTLPSLLIQQS